MKEPERDDIIGIWEGLGKAKLFFNNDGTFTGDSIPAEFGFFPLDSFNGLKFNGSGKWSLRKGNTHWEVYLDFNKVSVSNKNGCAFPLLIAKESASPKGKSLWYLFVWKEEEGGDRYTFLKKDRSPD